MSVNTSTVAQVDSFKSSNPGRYLETNLASYMLYNLCHWSTEPGGIHDFCLGMEMEEDFRKFDDVVVGLQKTKESHMEYNAFQIKGFNDKMGTHVKTICSTDVIPDLKGLFKVKDGKGSEGFDLKKLYTSGFLEMKEETCLLISKYIIYTQYKFILTDSDITYFTPVSECNSVQDIFHLLPKRKYCDGQLFKVSEKTIALVEKNWHESATCSNAKKPRLYKINGVRDFLSKVLIASNQPSAQEIKDMPIGTDWWKLLRLESTDFKYDLSRHWVSKSKLMKTEIMFQGELSSAINDEKGSVLISDLIDTPDAELLLKLYIDPESIKIGSKVKDLGEVEQYYIERTFKQYRKHEASVFKSEEELLRTERVVLIAGEPGMGKTVTLSKAAKSLKAEKGWRMWVVKIDLVNMSKIFQKNMALDTLEVLECAIGHATDLDSKCFASLFKKRHGNITVGLFLDGFDEVSEAFKDNVIEWIQNLRKYQIIRKIWISTRSYNANDIEKSLNVSSYSMAQFSRDDQIKFLRGFWCVKGENEHTFISFSNKLIDGLCTAIEKNVEQFIGLPLITMMIAEIYRSDYHMSCIDCLYIERWYISSFSTLSLFETFVSKKFLFQHAKYFTVKGQEQAAIDDLKSRERNHFIVKHSLMSLHHSYHQYPTFKNILTEEDEKEISQLLSKVKQPGCFMSGFIVNYENDILYFIHELFAEYFTAFWLFQTLSKLLSDLTRFKAMSPQLIALMDFLKEHHQSNKNSKVRSFLSLMAAQGNEIHIQVMERCLNEKRFRSNETSEKHFLTEKGISSENAAAEDRLGRLPVHCALEYKWHVLAMTLFKCLNDEDRQPLFKNNLWTTILHRDALHAAAAAGDVELTNILLEPLSSTQVSSMKDIDVNSADGSGMTPLLLASMNGHTETVRRLVDQGADMRLKALNGLTALHHSCQNGHDETTRLLLERGADPLAEAESGWSPLHEACKSGQENCARLLLQRDADINAKNAENLTPLILACQYTHYNVAKLLLDNHADINLKEKENGRAALHHAIVKDNVAIVSLLLEHKADITMKENDGETALELASKHGNLEIVRKLIEAGADVKSKGMKQESPLHHSCFYGHSKVAELLIESNADVEQSDKDGWTPLMSACWNGRTETARVLLRHGAIMTAKSQRGSTVLQCAAQNGHLETMKMLVLDFGADVRTGEVLHSLCMNGRTTAAEFLIDQGADINIPDNDDGWTPLHCACSNGHKDTVAMLLEKGVPVNIPDETGWTPLHVACRCDNTDTALFLLEHGADINKGDEDEATTLYFSAMYGWDSSVQMLLDRGANVNIARSTDGMSPLHIACQERRSQQVVKMLLEKGADVDALDNQGRNALIIACSERPEGEQETTFPEEDVEKENQEAIVSLLLKHGSDVNVQNEQGLTPVQMVQGSIRDMIENWIVARAILEEDVINNVIRF